MIFSIFYKIFELVVLLVKEMGYLGIFFGMAIESSFIPFPSEIILIPAGALAFNGQMNVFLIFIASILGCILGALFNYYLAFFLGRPTIDFLVSKYGKYFLLSQKHIHKSDLFFEKYGEITTFVGRLIPVVRQLISLPAGFSKMNLPKFILYTSLGAGIWTIVLIATGYLFANNLVWIEANKVVLSFISGLIALNVLIIYFIYTKKKKLN